jgi:hypothetical protein
MSTDRKSPPPQNGGLVLAPDRGVVTMPIDVHAPNAINMYLVPEHELSTYETAVADESGAQNAMFFCVGSALAMVTTLLTVPLGATMLALFGSLTFVTIVMGVWFLSRWILARRRRIDARGRMRATGGATRINQPLSILPSKTP